MEIKMRSQGQTKNSEEAADRQHLGKPFFYSPLITRYLPGKFMVTQKCY